MNEKERYEKLNELLRLTVIPHLKENVRKSKTIIGLQALTVIAILCAGSIVMLAGLT